MLPPWSLSRGLHARYGRSEPPRSQQRCGVRLPPAPHADDLPRVRLDSLERVRREMSRLYVEGKHGRREVQDVSRLANVLALIGRMIEGGEIERRLAALEERAERAR